jgi:hypothetical protein
MATFTSYLAKHCLEGRSFNVGAALSRLKAAPTGIVQAAENRQICDNRPTYRMPIMKKQAHLHH